MMEVQFRLDFGRVFTLNPVTDLLMKMHPCFNTKATLGLIAH